MSLARRFLFSLVVSSSLAGCDDDPVSQEVSADKIAIPGSASAAAVLNSHDQHGRPHIAIRDDCNPSDSEWIPTGGCVLRGGVVTEDEFTALLTSPLSLSVVGHPAWRNDPSYLRVPGGMSVRVTNEGGRTHTFTRVAQYGGGRVPPLNIGLTPAPECLPSAPNVNQLAPGEKLELNGLAAGNHKYQCCIHPWMRALVKVQ